MGPLFKEHGLYILINIKPILVITYLIQIELFQTQMIGVKGLWVDFVYLLANFHGFLDYGGKMQ